MMDIDFIKWLCEKVGWVEIEENKICEWIFIPKSEAVPIEYFIDNIDCPLYSIVYPLLLQRAIEGVNYDLKTYCITIMPYDIKVVNTTVQIDHIMFHMPHGEIDKAKESALKYIYEQETK